MFMKTLALALALMLSMLAVPQEDAYAAALTSQEEADLAYTREEEKVARDTYLTFYSHWKLAIFSNIASAEQSHMDAILKLLQKYGLRDPAAGNPVGTFTNSSLQALYNALVATGAESELSALKVGGLIEETDMRDIEAAVARAQHDDIISTYRTLLCGSRNHLRSFAKLVAAKTGQPYAAQLLTQEQVNTILESPMENCGS